MGIIDKLSQFFFSRSKEEVVKEVVEVKKKVEKTIHQVIIPCIYEKVQKVIDFADPQEIYIPRPSKNKYFYEHDVLEEDEIEKFEPIFNTITAKEENFEEREDIELEKQPINSSTIFVDNNFAEIQNSETLENQQEKKKLHISRFKKSPFSEFVSRRIIWNPENLSLPFIIPTTEKKINLSNVSILGNSTNNKNRLLVEKGDFVANLSIHNSGNQKFAIAIYGGEERALTSQNNYVFRVKEEVLDREFLNLLIRSEEFDKKLSYLAGHDKQSSQDGCIFWGVLIKNLWLNMPPLHWQRNLVERKNSIKELIKVKESICDELDKLMDIYFHRQFDQEEKTLKNFQELFSVDIEKVDKKFTYKLHNFKRRFGRFIFSSIKELMIEGCQFDKLNRLLLSKDVYGEETQEYFLHLWLGSEEFASCNKLYSINPKEALGMPYGYWLFKKNLNNLIEKLPSTKTKRFVSKTELKNYEFEIHSQEFINEFNRICQPILEYQKLMEEAIYKLTKLLEEDLQIIYLRVFNKRLSSQSLI